MYVFIVGPPMSGKSTLCAKLCQDTTIRFRHISLGASIRANKRYRDVIAGYLSRGELIPSKICMEILNGEIGVADDNVVYLIDGFPRSIKCLDQWALMGRGDPDIVLQLSTLTSTLYARRIVRCRVELRADDSMDIFEKRLAHYNIDTIAVLKMLEPSRVVVISGDGALESTVNSVLSVVGMHLEQVAVRAQRDKDLSADL